MAEITKAAAIELAQNGTDEEVNKQLRQLVDVDRRVISRKETIGYMLFDSFKGFNIDGHKEHFTVNVLKIGWNLQSYYNIFAGIWDILDDLLIAGIVEKTRTRWGKFIPYMAMSGLPLAFIGYIDDGIFKTRAFIEDGTDYTLLSAEAEVMRFQHVTNALIDAIEKD